MEPRPIVIVGGGFAGTTLARALDGKLPPAYELLLINEESHTTFTPMLPEVVGAGVFPEQIVAPIRQMLRRARFVMGRVTNIDFATRTIACETLAGHRLFPYEHVVLAFGSRARLDMIPGVAEHAVPLKTIGDGGRAQRPPGRPFGPKTRAMTSRRLTAVKVEHSIKPLAPVNREGVLTSVPHTVHCSNAGSATARCRLLSIGERQRTRSRVAEESSEG